MDRLNVRTLLLELTRECNLECRHCFRGDSQNNYLSLDIIDYVFKNVCRINELVLTGGEPFLAKKQIKRITENILKDRTNVGKTTIVTNGTVLSFDILGMLYQINKRSELEIRLSNDIFHLKEIERKNLQEKRDKNIQELKEMFDVTVPEDKIYIIDKIGRAESITDDEIKEINTDDSNKTKYILGTDKMLDNYRKNYPLPKIIEDDVVDGTLNIDVFGNISPTYYSFESEDKFNYSNIKKSKSLRMAIDSIDSSSQV